MKKIFITIGIVVVVSVLTAIIFSGKTAGYWIYTGYKLSGASKHEEALQAFDKALKLDPENATAWQLEGSALQFLGRYEESIKALNQAMKFSSDDTIDPYRIRGIQISIIESLNKLGRYEEAIAICDQLIKISKDYYYYENKQALLQKAFALGKLKRYDEAIDIYTANYLGYQDSETKYNRARIYSQKHQKTEALGDLKDAISISSNYKNKAINDMDFEWLWEDADFKQITARTNHEWRQYGNQLSGHGQYGEALKAYDQAIELNSQEFYVWEDKGYACLKLARYDQAAQAYEKALKLNPNSFTGWYNIACAYSLKQDKEHALSNLRRAVALQPQSKAGARKDQDFKWLWNDAEFKRITR
ncbi:MAG: tetratricopeptide repeat protein [Planctomycetes bacterium]|nr:tetratricopeptide repeat protein [Planctomycetota bacterium]